MHARTGRVAHLDVERGRATQTGLHHRAASLPRATLALLALLAVAFIFLVSRRYSHTWSLSSQHRQEQHQAFETGHAAGVDQSAQAGTCSKRLAALGLDFEGPGRTLLSTSTLQRRTTYSTMDGNIALKGLLLGGVITQGLRQADLYHFSSVTSTHVTISPVLKALDIPVRAMILPLLDEAAGDRILQEMQAVLMPALPPGSIWRQNHKLYHATVFHASSHVTPVPATHEEVEKEAEAIRGVTGSMCPIKGVLDRVIITTSGVIVACWQVLPSGTDPVDLRQGLAHALPHAPPKEGQMVKEPSMLHTTIARLLQPPEELHATVDAAAVATAVQQLNDRLCGLATTFNEVWFVEEQDLLALALEGRYIKHVAPLTCPHAAREFG